MRLKLTLILKLAYHKKIFELKSSMTPTLEIHKLKLYENNDENCFTRKLLIKSAKEGVE